jgi:hypothetical protein
MRSRHRLLSVVCGLAVLAALALGCAPSEDESTDAPPVAPAAPSGGGGLSGGLPSPDAAVQLDPATKGRCDAVWSLGVFVYSAHTMVNAPANEKDRLKQGVTDNEPKAAGQVPELANDFKALADHSLLALSSSKAVPLSPDLSAANQRLVDYLRTTCKFKAT